MNRLYNSESTLDNQSNFAQGWECPRCGRINAPWKDSCDCKDFSRENNNWEYQGLPGDVYNPGKIDINDYPKFIPCNKLYYELDPCKYCNNNPENGGSGICNCILGDMYKVIC